MNQIAKLTKAYLIVTAISMIFAAKICNAGLAAPYTEEAYFKIETAQKNSKLPKLPDNPTPFDRQKAIVESFRIVFKQAGFDFDSTIRKVAYDLKNNPEKVPKNRNTVTTIIVITLSQMKSNRTDWLSLFDNETSKSIKWLWENTGFSP